ncbi:MAG: YebC/PmpR family DNA-binding transcriptional regulator [Candidatus Symbiobacter sp.]|nr:YebC/PmpR family DNA-binding transcriptional regulator [Candidatus Symbiobacter sp.]
MAGHSHAKNIMHRKGAQDARRGKIFTKLIRELTVAAKTGIPDPASNPRLRSAIAAAREANMTRDTIDRAIKRGAGGEDDANYEEVRYEGYGPGGVAIIVEALTDNRNRTASDIRSTFAKMGGALGEMNSVAFSFQRVGQIKYGQWLADKSTMTEERLMETALDCGADDVYEDHELNQRDDEVPVFYAEGAVDNFAALRDGLEQKFGEAASAKLVWKAQNTTPISDEILDKLIKLIELLEDNDDVQTVTANHQLSEAQYDRLANS